MRTPTTTTIATETLRELVRVYDERVRSELTEVANTLLAAAERVQKIVESGGPRETHYSDDMMWRRDVNRALTDATRCLNSNGIGGAASAAADHDCFMTALAERENRPIKVQYCRLPRGSRTRTQSNKPTCPEHGVQHRPYEGYPVCPDCGRYREYDACSACGFSPK